MLKTRFNGITDKLEFLFKILLLFYSFLSKFFFTVNTPAVSLVMWPCFFLGFLLILNRIINIKRYTSPYQWFLVALLAMSAVTVLIHKNLDFKGNAVFLVLWAFYFLLLYVNPNDRQPEQTGYEMRVICGIYTVLTEICCLIGLGMLVAGFGAHYDVSGGGELLVGIVYNRLVGVFCNPNLGAVSVILASLFVAYAAVNLCKKTAFRVLCGFLIFANFLFVALSDSRTGLVATAAVLFIISWKLLCDKFNGKLTLKIAAFALAVFIALAGAITPVLIKRGYNAVVSYSGISESSTIKRTYDIESDISNRRFDVWKGGLEVFVSRPVEGITFCGIKDYTLDNMPDNYLVNNDFMQMITLDNDVLNILVSNGIIGFVPCMIFSFGVFIFCIKGVLKKREKGLTAEIVLLAALVMIACCSMFGSFIFYANTAPTYIFWLMLGYLTLIFKKSMEEEAL